MNIRKKSIGKMLSLSLTLVMALIPLFPVGVKADQTYTAAADSAITGGAITLSSTSVTTPAAIILPEAGETVTVTVTPDAGKQLKAGSLRFTPENGTATLITDSGSGYSFSMPAANVTVTAQFEDAAAPLVNPPYTAAADSATTGGAITLSSTSVTTPAAIILPEAGETVTVTVTPDPGKQLVAGSLKYTPEGAAAVQIPVANNTGNFIMPSANVLVTAQFVTQSAIATGTSTVFSVSAPAPNLTVGDTFTMTAAVTATGGGAYGFEGGFAVTLSGYSNALNPSPLQLDTAKFATDNAGIPGITVDTTMTPGYVFVYVESDGQTLKIPEGVTTIKFPFKVINTQAAATTTLALNDSLSGACKWTLLTNPAARVRATGTGLTTLNFNQTNIGAAVGLGYAISDAGTHNLDGLTIAFAANAAFTLDKTQAAVGDTVTVTATVNSTVDAYGFTGVLQYTAANLTLDTNATAAANPALTLTFTGNNGSNRITCQSAGKVITANTPLALALKFKVTNTTASNLTVNFGTYGLLRLLLFKNATVTAADVATTAQITAQETAGAIAIAPSTASPAFTTIQAATVALAADGTDSGKIGDTLTVKATINSTVDAYGFTGSFTYPYSTSTPHGQITPDLTATQAANSGISGLTVDTSTGGYVRFTCDPAGQTKVITAGTPLTLILKFKVVGTADSTTTNLAINVGTLNNRLVLFTDSSVTYASLYNSNTTTFNNNINAAETAGKAAIIYLSGSAANLHTLFDAGVAFDTPTANVGGNEQPVTVTAKITAPADKDVYGFETAIVYQGKSNITTDLQLDPVATTAANAGILAGKVNVGSLPPSGLPNYTVKVWVESDGTTPIIEKGKTLDLKLVFKVPPFNGEGTLTVNAGTAGNRFVLFTDPSIRANATGDGLTALNFNTTTISTQEGLGNVVIAGATAGGITKTRAITGLTMSSGSYVLSTPADVLTFADAVNTLGYTAINATVQNDIDMTGTAFAGIGTKDHPFTGTISSSSQIISKTIKIDRVVSDGSSAVGGFVNYLGSGGKLSCISASGTITGAFGGASVGGLVGVSDGGSIVAPAVSSVSISGTASDGANIGGIVGSLNYHIGSYGNSPKYTGSISVTAAQGSTVNVGGIAGAFDGTGQTDSRQIFLCYNTGNISGGTNTGSIVGSIKNGIIRQSGNGAYTAGTTQFNGTWSGGGVVTGSGNTGGIAGRAAGTTFSNVFNTGAVSGSGGSTGGIVGYITGTGTSVAQSYNTAAVTGSGSSVGGIVGENDSADSAVTCDFNLGNVTATGSEPNAGAIVGKATAAPAVYQGNYYMKNGSVNSGIGDALDNTAFTADSGNKNAVSASNPGSFSLTGIGSGSPSGIYIFISQPPLTDADGTYLLSTVDDILWFYQTVNNNTEFGTQNLINGRLVNNIDMSKVSSAQFSGIGGGGLVCTRYAGTFDGAGHTVTVKNSPLFNQCVGATIKNLTVDGSLSGIGIGGIVNSITDGLIENCHNKADINSTDGHIGGIACQAMNSTISGCTNSGKITGGPDGNIGGIVGTIGGLEMEVNSGSDVKPTHSVIINCTNSGDITGGKTIGGICGVTGGANCTADFINCTNTGKVTSTAQTSSGLSGVYNPVYENSAGGILGGARDITVNIDSCTNSGTVTGTANSLGGIVGFGGPSWGIEGPTSLEITNSTNSGKVISTVDPNAVDTSYGSHPISPDNIYVGGIMGSATRIEALDISGNIQNGVVDKGFAAHADPFLGSGNYPIGQNNTSFNTPPNNTPPDNTPSENTPSENTPSENTPSENTPSENTPSENTPPDNTPSDNTPPNNTPSENTPPDNTPSNNTPPSNTPLSNTPPSDSKPASTPSTPQTPTVIAMNNSSSASENPAEKSAANPAPEQNNNSPAASETPATEPGSTTGVNLKGASVFEVVRDTVKNNPVAAAATVGAVVGLAGLGGFLRFRRFRIK